MIGKEFDDFRIIKSLGEGATGRVFLAKQISLNRDVAIKFLSNNLNSSLADVAMKRFLNEAKLLATIKHPNIVSILKIGELNGQYFIAMEAINGGAVDKYFDRKIFSATKEKEVWRSILAVVGGLEKALSNGIIHRDIKPENILLDEGNQPKLCDFGISKKLDDNAQLTIAGVVVGSPHFISPEQVIGGGADFHSDMYSLGATAYRLLTGKTMFEGDVVIDILFKQRSGKPVSPRTIVHGISDQSMFILGKMLHKSPHDRYLTYKDLAHDIKNLLKNLPLVFANGNDARKTFDFAKDSHVFKSETLFHRQIKFSSLIQGRNQKERRKLLVCTTDNADIVGLKMNEFDIHFAGSTEEAKYALSKFPFILLIAPNDLGAITIDFLSTLKSCFPQTPFFFIYDENVDATQRYFFVRVSELRNRLKSFTTNPPPRLKELTLKDITRLITLFQWTMRLGLFAFDNDGVRGCVYFNHGKRGDFSSADNTVNFYVWGATADELKLAEIHKCDCPESDRKSFHNYKMDQIKNVSNQANNYTHYECATDCNQTPQSNNSLTLSAPMGKNNDNNKLVVGDHTYTKQQTKENEEKSSHNNKSFASYTSMIEKTSASKIKSKDSHKIDSDDQNIGSRTFLMLTIQRQNDAGNSEKMEMNSVQSQNKTCDEAETNIALGAHGSQTLLSLKVLDLPDENKEIVSKEFTTDNFSKHVIIIIVTVVIVLSTLYAYIFS